LRWTVCTLALIDAILDAAVNEAAQKPLAEILTIDIIVIEPNGHGIGWPSFECKISFADTEHWRTTRTR
jgi:hypothetical protein